MTSQRRAVILDDDPLMLSLLNRVLRRRGYDVVTYQDPTGCPMFDTDSCPCSARECCPDVILTDINMPAVNGIEFVNKLNLIGCRCKHIAMISGHWTEEVLQEVLPLGVSVFAKPFYLESLYSWLDKAEKDGQKDRK